MSLLDSLKVERLVREHDLNYFSCEVTSLNNFLYNDALNHQRQRISFTTVYLLEEQVIAYVTLANDAITLELDLNYDDLDTRYPQIPALKICRIARDQRYIGEGIGEFIIEDVIGYAHSLNNNENIFGTGCRFVTADVRNPKLLTNFYHPNNFVNHAESEDKQGSTIYHVRYDLGTLED